MWTQVLSTETEPAVKPGEDLQLSDMTAEHLKSHQLINPVDKLVDRMWDKHDGTLKLWLFPWEKSEDKKAKLRKTKAEHHEMEGGTLWADAEVEKFRPPPPPPKLLIHHQGRERGQSPPKVMLGEPGESRGSARGPGEDAEGWGSSCLKWTPDPDTARTKVIPSDDGNQGHSGDVGKK